MAAFIACLTAVMVQASPARRVISPETRVVYLHNPVGNKPRIIVTTDPELDDSNSMVRYLLYANDFDTVGLIYASSKFHWSGDMRGTLFNHAGREYSRAGTIKCPCTSYRWPTGELHIDRAVDAYAQVFPNLRVHDPSYPAPGKLRSTIRWGNVGFEGDMSQDTAGSDLIKELLLDRAATPLYLLAWGGESTIARALKAIEEQYRGRNEWPAIKSWVTAKAVIVASGHQDDTYENYIKPSWPLIRYQESADGVPLGYGAQAQVSEEDSTYFSAAWTRANILKRGPLGAMYRVWGDGLQMVPGDRLDYFGLSMPAEQLAREGYVLWAPLQEKGSFIGEGDSPTFLNFIDNGLQGFRDDMPGGWAGHRMTPADAQRLANMYAEFLRDPTAAMHKPRRATDPFVAASQRDFAARMQWSVTSDYKAANHRPVVTLTSASMVHARPGETVVLSAVAVDPDGNHAPLRWWRWKAADSYEGVTRFESARDQRTNFLVPTDASEGQAFQIIAEAVDNGSPALVGYAKVLIVVSAARR